MADWRPGRAKVEMTRVGAWLIGLGALAFLVGGTFNAVSLWNGPNADTGTRIFIAVWLVLMFLLVGNILRICFRRTSTTLVPPGIRMDLKTPFFKITHLDDRSS